MISRSSSRQDINSVSTLTRDAVRMVHRREALRPDGAGPRVSFVGSGFAGHATRFRNLRSAVVEDARLAATFHEVTGWNDGGVIERMPIISRPVKGRVRGVLETSRVARVPRPDALWTSVREELMPFFWAQRGPFRRPMLYDLDCTDTQLEEMSWDYFGRRPKQGLRRTQARICERIVQSQVTLFAPWSNWARRGLESDGIDPGRIRVIPPGVDLCGWQQPSRDTSSRRLRVLFVGGDFRRKGGDLLVEAAAGRSEDLELVLVTRDDVGRLPRNARLLRSEPNTDSLRDAFAWADLFVLPTRAECFGLATVEAMASGLPTIVGDVGAARDIVAEGETGWLIEPTAQGLRRALDEALERRQQLPQMGTTARKRAEQYFDGRRQGRIVIDTLLEMIEDSAR